ncbi:CAH4 anhydrase, partial [Amia calva]|nr:CAH4 anhydrase [Amia calva]
MNGVQVSGGGLSTTYSATQFHLHWGNGSSVPGSEHTVDSMRYAMEMHVVHLKNGYNMTQALNDPEGVAVLGFLIECGEAIKKANRILGDSLFSPVSGQTKSLSLSLSMDDLLSGVDRSKYYRYKGSLTTPNCNEVVVWTVFNETLKVSRNLVSGLVTMVSHTTPTLLFPEEGTLTQPFTLPHAGSDLDLGTFTTDPSYSTIKHLQNTHRAGNETTWISIPNSSCNQKGQSPINIQTQSVVLNKSLGSFNFTGYSNCSKFKSIENNGHTVQVNLMNGVVVSGGGLSTTYNATQLHFHWGNGSSVPGSEHTVYSKRYPMEMHVVYLKKIYSTTDQAQNDPEGLAVLAFFIEVNTVVPLSKVLYLDCSSKIPSCINGYKFSPSMDNLLAGVNRGKYFRYKGSLTTPCCNETVVWTVFTEPVKVSRDLVSLFNFPPRFLGLVLMC